MLSLPITTQLIPEGHPNRPGLALAARGVVWHRTGRDVGPVWLGGYFARDPQGVVARRGYGSSHYGVGDEGVFLYIPEEEWAYGAASDRTDPPYSRNGTDLHVEICQYLNVPPRITPKTYANAVALAAELCERHGWEGPREVGSDAVRRFTRHQDWDPVDRPNDPGAFLRWDDFLDDVEEAILTGRGWHKRKEGKVEDAILELVGAVKGLGESIVVWLARLQRGLDVERRNTPFDPKVPPLDPRV